MNCTFVQTAVYTCKITANKVLDESQRVIISGDHLEGKSGNDVEVVHVLNSNIPFMMQEIIKTFPNIRELVLIYDFEFSSRLKLI
jgi:hypothetical protein